jgi:H/ACA ribonucleoprotein complex subunit 4
MISPPWTIQRGLLVKAEEETNPEYGCPPEKRSIYEHLTNGLIILDKPPGPTSHEVVAWVKRILNINRAGHGGTLEASAGETQK